MSKIIALDIGDVWVGVALTDAAQMLARPYATIRAAELVPYLCQVMAQEQITGIVIGHPITMRGTKSEQTYKVERTHRLLSQIFIDCSFWLFDERLSSKRALELGRKKGKRGAADKRKEHARAAAFILDGLLLSRRMSYESME